MKQWIRIILVLLGLWVSHSGMAQGDRVEQLRVAFINRKLELSTEEAEKFWPVYNEYNDKIKAIRKNLRMNYRNREASLSEQEAEELYQLDLKSKQAEVDVHKLYSERIKAIIGVKKSVRLRVAEEQFKREMINTIKDKGD